MQSAHNLSTAEHNFTKSDKQFTKEITIIQKEISFSEFSSFFVKLYSIKRSWMQSAHNLSTVEHNFTKSDKQFTKESTILQNKYHSVTKFEPSCSGVSSESQILDLNWFQIDFDSNSTKTNWIHWFLTSYQISLFVGLLTKLIAILYSFLAKESKSISRNGFRNQIQNQFISYQCGNDSVTTFPFRIRNSFKSQFHFHFYF